jgi:hypothetical protein
VIKPKGRSVLYTRLEPVIGLAKGEAQWRGMTGFFGTAQCASPAMPSYDRRLAMADSRPERRASEGVARTFAVARVFQSREEIFLALAFEFFLSRFEDCHARSNFFALPSAAVLLFSHAHPF